MPQDDLNDNFASKATTVKAPVADKDADHVLILRDLIRGYAEDDLVVIMNLKGSWYTKQRKKHPHVEHFLTQNGRHLKELTSDFKKLICGLSEFNVHRGIDNWLGKKIKSLKERDYVRKPDTKSIFSNWTVTHNGNGLVPLDFCHGECQNAILYHLVYVAAKINQWLDGFGTTAPNSNKYTQTEALDFLKKMADMIDVIGKDILNLTPKQLQALKSMRPRDIKSIEALYSTHTKKIVTLSAMHGYIGQKSSKNGLR